VRGFYSNADGEENHFLPLGKEFGADPESYFNHKPSKLTWCAMEETEIFEINFQKFEELSKRNVGLLKLRIMASKRLLNRMYERLESFILYSLKKDSSIYWRLILIYAKEFLINIWLHF
jgi:hypothetical protein